MPIFAFIGGIGWQEMIILFAIILIIFGPRKLPEVAEAFGKSIQRFKRASREARDEIQSGIDEEKQDDTEKK